MSLKLAKMAVGFCAGCGVLIDGGEYYSAESAGVRHPTCNIVRGLTSPAQAPTPLPFPSHKSTREQSQRIGSGLLNFAGDTFDSSRDGARLSAQMGRVAGLMRDGGWRTLTQIATATECLETSAGARLRDLRKQEFGGHQVFRRFVGGRHEYKVIFRGNISTDERIAV
jgi:hypothetical protein